MSHLKASGPASRSKAAGKSQRKSKSQYNAANASKRDDSGKMQSWKKMNVSRRTNKNSTVGGSRRRRKKEDVARVLMNGEDVTPKPLFVPQKGRPNEGGYDIDVDLKVGEMMELAPDEEVVQAENQPVAAEPEKKTFVPDEKWMKKRIAIKITETETMTVLHIPSQQVWDEDEDAIDVVTARNEAYEACLERHKEKDKFINRSAQTFNLTHRQKNIQARPPETKETGAQVTTWDIYDAFNEEDELQDESDAQFATINVKAEEADKSGAYGGVDASQHASQSINGSSVGGGGGVAKAGTLNVASPFERVLRMPKFKKALEVLEQAIIQTNIHNQQLLYRSHKDARDLDTHEKISTMAEAEEQGKNGLPPRLSHLWTFVCQESQGKNVSCMCFNKQNKDLLAVGYGGFKFGNNETGRVMFWSLKNPTHPQKVITTKFGVTSLDFSSEHPHLLALGLYDGSVNVYDIREDHGKPTLESQHATGKHSEPVWGVKWVAKEANKEQQQLMSVSTDGSVKQWSMKKGLVPHQLMQLKRIPNKEQLVSSHMEGISREASGLCFDFPVDDSTQYFAGTEGGIIHKCSVSYNEQTLENFFGHTGPVYKVRTSPFLSDAFLSCSADWTCALWSQSNVKPTHVFQSGNDYMMDIQWSPANSTVFGTVSRDGRVEVWDLGVTRLDPVIQHKVDEKELSTVLFAPDCPVIVTGANDGTIDVYRVNGVALDDAKQWSLDEQTTRLTQAMYDHSEAGKKE